jgi:hypothetical protein
VSAEEDDLRRLIALMRHDLRNWQAIPVSPSGSIFHSHSHSPKAMLRADPKLTAHEESRSIWENLTLVSILLNEPKGGNHGLKKLLSEATAVCLFANLSQVSHSIKELHDSGFSITVPGLKEKVFFADLFVHVFDSDRLHEIVTQALPELWERGPYGERPVLMSENYDCRYTDLGRIGTELMGSAKGLDHAARRAAARRSVQRWQDEKLSFSPPFTRKVLNDVFYRIASDSH